MRIDTPTPSTPEAVAAVIDQIVDHFDDVRGDSPIGVTIPGVVTHGMVRSAANIDKSWLDFDAEPMLEKVLGHDIVAGQRRRRRRGGRAALRRGEGPEGPGILTTLGTGIGTALIYDGVLVPNSELGHLELDGHDAESRAASSIKDKEGLSYPVWAERLQRYYSHLEALLGPTSSWSAAGCPRTPSSSCRCSSCKTPIVAAKLENKAGIIGAAHLAAHK